MNLTTNEVSRVYNMGNATLASSLLDDVRFNPAANKAYLSDAGVPALIVLDLATGEARRFLEIDISTTGSMPVSAEENLVHASGGGLAYVYADQMEVSPDAKWLYYQPPSGGMYRIKTRYLDDVSIAYKRMTLTKCVLTANRLSTTPLWLVSSRSTVNPSPSRLLQAARQSTPRVISTLAILTARLLRLSQRMAHGRRSCRMTDCFGSMLCGEICAYHFLGMVLTRCTRLDSSGRLWMPAAQLNRGTPFNNGSSLITKPLHVFTIDVGNGPSPIDHP